MSDETDRVLKRQKLDRTRQLGQLVGVSDEVQRHLLDLTGVNRMLEQERLLLSPRLDTLGDLIGASNYIHQLRPLDPIWRQNISIAQQMADQVEVARTLAGLNQIGSALASIQSENAARLLDAQRFVDQAFRFPELDEVNRLVTQYRQGSVAEWVGATSHQQADLEHMLKSIQQPYLQIDHVLRSVSAVAELQGIGQAIARGDAYGLDFAKAIRSDLGDWRDAVAWPLRLEEDAKVRVDLYLQQGLNWELTDFPEGAFEEVLGLTDLDITEADVDSDDSPGTPDLLLVADGNPMMRMGHAYQSLFAFERRLRAFIDACMTRLYGSEWPKTRLPNGLYDRWCEKQQKAMAQGAPEECLIAYADFTDYESVICRRDNWDQAFKPIFQRQENVRESMQRLYPARLAIMHARFITQQDQLFLYVEIARLSKSFWVSGFQCG